MAIDVSLANPPRIAGREATPAARLETKIPALPDSDINEAAAS